jgi:hypothetical protein
MKYFCIFLCLLLTVGTVHAQSVLIGKRLISKGDDIARVRDIAGAADRIDKIPADEFSPAMEIWTYNHNGQQVVLWIVGTKVVQAQEQPAVIAPKGGGSAASSAKD